LLCVLNSILLNSSVV